MIKNYKNETVFIKKDDKIIEIKSSGIAEVSVISSEIHSIEEIPVNRSVFGPVKGLPAPDGITIYIVSKVVMNALNGSRNDVVCVDKKPVAESFIIF